MSVECAKLSDLDSLINLSKEVEDLFGPMANEITFHEALKEAIIQKVVFCIRPSTEGQKNSLSGGVVISKETNEILWFVVSNNHQKHGYGSQLLKFALSQFDTKKDIFVQTFDESVASGAAARKLYLKSGFVDDKDGGLNPAGVPTVIMRLTKPNI